MGWLSSLFKREVKENPLERRIRTLRDYLSDNESNNEITVVGYKGPSAELIKYCSKHNLTCDLYEETTFGTRAQLAKEELKKIYRDVDNMRIRALAGRALGIRPIEIFEYHKQRKEINRNIALLAESDLHLDDLKTIKCSLQL